MSETGGVCKHKNNPECTKKKRRSLSVENVEVGHYEIGRVWKHQNNPECTIKKEVKSVENVEHYETGGVWKHQNNPECTKKKRRSPSFENVEVGHYDYTKEGEVRW